MAWGGEDVLCQPQLHHLIRIRHPRQLLFPGVDSDGDGVPDDKDKCPNQGGGESGVGKDGCPLVN